MLTKSVKLILQFSLLLICSCSNSSFRQRADVHRKDKDYQAAIQALEKHIASRLEIKNRPEWENPYLYYLDIGDIYLEQGDSENALKYYLLADEQKVKASYVDDRIRFVARWFEEKGDLKSAIELLQKYRERDPLLFDLVLDRVARQMVLKENQ